MSPTTTKRHASAIATLSILAAASALYLLVLGEYVYERGDVDYRRRLQPSHAPVPNPHSCSAAPRPSCDGVLVTSQGGVGSSDFIAALEHAVELERGGAPFCVNDGSHFDGFKHRPAWAYGHNSTSLVRRASGRGREACFWKVMVIVGDPVHTVESTHRRFGMSHINKVRRAVGLLEHPGISKISALYNHIASSGEDQTGITNFVTSWYEASKDRASWPEVRLVAARTLYDNAAEHAKWIGVGEGALRNFSFLHYDASKQYRTEMSVTDESVREKVLDVFRNVTEIVTLYEDTPPLVPGHRGRPRRRTTHKLLTV